MLVSTDASKVLIGVPKNGSQTIRVVGEEQNLSLVHERATHPTLDEVRLLCAKQNILLTDNFEVYGFYRHPVKRFLSAFEFQKKHLIASVMFMFPEKFEGMTRPHEGFLDDISNVSPEILDIVNNVTELEVINRLFTFPSYVSIYWPQTRWLNDCNHVLDFENFQTEFSSLIELFGGTSPQTIPIVNSTTLEKTQPSEELINKILTFYAQDVIIGETHGYLS